jgi:D-3-phosphoglycerate dehydrogenase / 2-oxoglutarate reductase
VPAPIVLFVDDALPLEPFAEALAPQLRCSSTVDDGEVGDVVAIVTGAVPVGEQVIDRFPALRLLLTCSVGTDHLDLAALEGRGVAAANTPTYCTEEVAEHALACVLAGWRGLWRHARATREGRWDDTTAGMLRRADRSRLGIVGLGRIGRALARLAAALSIDVVAHDPWVTRSEVPLLALDELLRTSDAVSLHVPGARGGPPLIGARELALMVPHAGLVNVSRAQLVDLDALVEALDAGRLGWAAWDVWPDEPPHPADPRLRCDGLAVTPHVGWMSSEADDAWRAEALDVLRTLVDDDAGDVARAVRPPHRPGRHARGGDR